MKAPAFSSLGDATSARMCQPRQHLCDCLEQLSWWLGLVVAQWEIFFATAGRVLGRHTTGSEGRRAREVDEVEKVDAQEDGGDLQQRQHAQTQHVELAVVLGELVLALDHHLEVLLDDLDALLLVDRGRVLVRAQYGPLRHEERGHDDGQEGDHNVHVHEDVGHDDSAAVGDEAQRGRRVRVRCVGRREEQVTRDLIAFGSVPREVDGQEQHGADAHADDDDARHSLRLQVLALQVGDPNGGAYAIREWLLQQPHSATQYLSALPCSSLIYNGEDFLEAIVSALAVGRQFRSEGDCSGGATRPPPPLTTLGRLPN
ncbi:hypothetical protein ON010_g17711 [Phytophthora cinnamomi]|nr:hypothetical protein ON010_g17711 [Phytophthora cinnamomi]